MRKERINDNSGGISTGRVLLCICLLLTSGTTLVAATDEEGPVQHTEDGLDLVPDTNVMAAWLKPGADFSGYTKVMIKEAPVQLVDGWLQNHNRQAVRRLTQRDVDNIKADTSKIFRDAFVAELGTDGAFEVVEEVGPDVLLLKPAIVDLDVTAPDARGTGTGFNIVTSAGAATLFLELFDSVSGDILARAVDRQAADSPSDRGRVSTRGSNRGEATRVFAGWADELRDALEELRRAPSGG